MISKLLPYIQLARWDKPMPAGLLLWPCWWGLVLAQPGVFHIKEMMLFLIGTVLLRGAGCTYNDMVDRDIDAQVQRTAQRPLAAKTITMSQSVFFLILQLITGLIVLLQFPPYVWKVGLCVMPLVALYPWMKRFTHWPQFFLGLTFNWGIFIGWSTLMPTWTFAPLWLYGAGICWTLGYDTIYALQDRLDDARMGVKSLAQRFYAHIKVFLGLVYGLMMLCLIILGYIQKFNLMYYMGLLVLALHLGWQIKTLDPTSSSRCAAIFRSNILTGGIVFIILNFINFG